MFPFHFVFVLFFFLGFSSYFGTFQGLPLPVLILAVAVLLLLLLLLTSLINVSLWHRLSHASTKNTLSTTTKSNKPKTKTKTKWRLGSLSHTHTAHSNKTKQTHTHTLTDTRTYALVFAFTLRAQTSPPSSATCDPQRTDGADKMACVARGGAKRGEILNAPPTQQQQQ